MYLVGNSLHLNLCGGKAVWWRSWLRALCGQMEGYGRESWPEAVTSNEPEAVSFKEQDQPKAG